MIFDIPILYVFALLKNKVLLSAFIIAIIGGGARGVGRWKQCHHTLHNGMTA